MIDMKRARVQLIIDCWSRILRGEARSRDDVARILKELYEKHKVEPIRGVSKPADIYDKEIASVYVIGKYGLGLDQEIDSSEDLRNIFSIEIDAENLVKLMIRGKTRKEICEEWKDLCSKLNEFLILRSLRFAFTMMYFDFLSKEDFNKFLRKLYEEFQEYGETIRRIAKFYLAYRLGEILSKNEAINKIDFDIKRNILGLELGIPRAVPGPRYVIDVAKHFFNLPKSVVDRVISPDKSATKEKNSA